MKRTKLIYGILFGVLAVGSAYAENETVVTSKKYVDDELAKKQPQFSGLGNDKLMLYSNATNGATLSRDIVTILGDSTTADSVPTRGAINTGLNTKQNTLNGTEGWVVENTGTAGQVKARPVYSTTDNYKTALVEAKDLNQMVINAVNSELTQVTDGWRINNSVTLPTLKAVLDVSVNGTSYCYRSYYGTSYYSSDGSCNSSTLTALGASTSKNGNWGAVFEYGDIVGQSVCSATASVSETMSTNAQESSLNSEFYNQSNSSDPSLKLSSSQKYCWCRMKSIDGASAVSRWVGVSSGAEYSAMSSNFCAQSCAKACGYSTKNINSFRLAMFNARQQ